MNTTNPQAIIVENAAAMSPPLCPELKLHLLKATAPLKQLPPSQFYADGVCPYWGFAWSAGQALARYVLDNPALVRDKHVHDCGAGSGIAAIAAAKAGAALSEASDMDRTAITSIEMNATLNDVSVTAIQADFRTLEDTGFDVLLIGDVFYKSRDTAWIMALNKSGRRILVSNALGRDFPELNAREVARYTARTYPDIEPFSIVEAVILELHPDSQPD